MLLLNCFNTSFKFDPDQLKSILETEVIGFCFPLFLCPLANAKVGESDITWLKSIVPIGIGTKKNRLKSFNGMSKIKVVARQHDRPTELYRSHRPIRYSYRTNTVSKYTEQQRYTGICV